jgi:hypothetical protein
MGPYFSLQNKVLGLLIQLPAAFLKAFWHLLLLLPLPRPDIDRPIIAGHG